MKNKNSISLFTKEFNIKRNIPNHPYAGLTWENIELLFSSILLDMVNSLSSLDNCDIFLFTKNSELKKDLVDKISEKAFIIEVEENCEPDRLKFAMKYIANDGYARNVFLFNYFPICDINYYKNVFHWLADEQEYIFISPLKDMSLGMLAMRDILQTVLNNISNVKALGIEDVINKLINQDAYLVNTGTLPSVIDLDDLLYLKQKVFDLAKMKLAYPKFTYETLKQFSKKYTNNYKSYETRNFRRYF